MTDVKPAGNATSNSNQDSNDVVHTALERKLVKWTGAVAIFTLALVIASAFSDYFIWQQYAVANKALQDTRDQLRAFVKMEGGPILAANVISGKPTSYAFFTKFHNYGGTRTNTFTPWTSIHYFPESVPNSQDFSKPWNDIDTSRQSVISPNSDLLLSAVTISREDADAVMNNKGVIVIWGEGDWSDIYDKSIKHISYCVSLIPKLAPDGINLSFESVPFRKSCNQS